MCACYEWCNNWSTRQPFLPSVVVCGFSGNPSQRTDLPSGTSSCTLTLQLELFSPFCQTLTKWPRWVWCQISGNLFIEAVAIFLLLFSNWLQCESCPTGYSKCILGMGRGNRVCIIGKTKRAEIWQAQWVYKLLTPFIPSDCFIDNRKWCWVGTGWVNTMASLCLVLQESWREEVEKCLGKLREDGIPNDTVLLSKREEELRHVQDVRVLYEQKLQTAEKLYKDLKSCKNHLEAREMELQRLVGPIKLFLYFLSFSST